MQNNEKTKFNSVMKAIICSKYGSSKVLSLRKIEKPMPHDDEILVKVFSTTVTSGDVNLRKGAFGLVAWLPARLALGFKGPRKSILGSEFTGEIEQIGKNIKNFNVGDKVFGSTGTNLKANAEYIIISEKGLIAKKPTNVHFEDVSSVWFGGNTALYFLRKADISKGQKILIYGASGSIGTFAVQLAKYFGAEVTGVCSTSNVDLVKSIGADTVIDYTKEEYSLRKNYYDIVFDTIGYTKFSDVKKILKEKGIYLEAVMKVSHTFKGLISNIKVISGMASSNPEELEFLKGVIEEGKLKPVIDRKYPLEELRIAHEYVERGHKRGNVVITVNDNIWSKNYN